MDSLAGEGGGAFGGFGTEDGWTRGKTGGVADRGEADTDGGGGVTEGATVPESIARAGDATGLGLSEGGIA